MLLCTFAPYENAAYRWCGAAPEPETAMHTASIMLHYSWGSLSG